jgi:hypothetical protein
MHTLRESRNEVIGSRACFQAVQTQFVKVKRCVEGAFLAESCEREWHCIALVVERFAVPESDLPERKFRRARLVALKSRQQIALQPFQEPLQRLIVYVCFVQACLCVQQKCLLCL